MHQELLILGKTRPFCFMHYTNIGKVEIFHVKVKVALLITRRHSEWAWNEKLSAKVNPDMFKALIKDEFLMTLIKLRLGFLVAELS